MKTAMNGARVVVLFDIDGTLLTTRGAGWSAFVEAFARQFGVAIDESVPCLGRTDRGIVSDLFQMHKIEDSPENWSRFHGEYCIRLKHFLPIHGGMTLPGVTSLLGDLTRQPDISIGLLTGNVRRGAQI